EIRRELSTPGPEPSAPGEAPHAQTSRLRSSVSFEADPSNDSVRIVVPVDYAGYLEHGTSKMEARPFIQQVIDKNRNKIISMMTTPRKNLFARAVGAISDFFRGSPGDFGSNYE